MKWLELCIDTAQDGLDKLEAMLSALGIDGIEIEDEADFQSFLAGNEKYWDYVDDDLLAQKKGKCRIKCYLEDNEEAAAQLARVRLGMEDVKKAHPGAALGPMILTVTEVQDADWENNWKQYYQPIEIGERLRLVHKGIDFDILAVFVHSDHFIEIRLYRILADLFQSTNRIMHCTHVVFFHDHDE